MNKIILTLFFVYTLFLIQCTKEEVIESEINYKVSANINGQPWNEYPVSIPNVGMHKSENKLRISFYKATDDYFLEEGLTFQYIPVQLQDTTFIQFAPEHGWSNIRYPFSHFNLLDHHYEYNKYILDTTQNKKSWIVLSEITEEYIEGTFEAHYVITPSPFPSTRIDTLHFTEGYFLSIRH